MKIEFERDKETGELLVYKDGQYSGKIETMGDIVEEGEKAEIMSENRG